MIAEVTTMVPQIKNLLIILLSLCFLIGCVQVKHAVTDVKDAFVGEKESSPKTPPGEPKETKPSPAPAKKATPKKTQPPAGEVFGPK